MSKLKEAYIVDAIRTPVGKFCGTMSTVRPDDMAALVIKELMQRNSGVDPGAINDVVLGCANQAGEDNRDVARMALLLAGLPYTVPGETVNRLCSSGMAATINCARAIQVNEGDLFISGGVESMTRAPFVMAKADTAYSRKAEVFDTSIGWRFVNPKMDEQYGTEGMGETAENLAEKYNISREDQDAFAAYSQQKASKAKDSGRFKSEIISVEIPQRKKDSITFSEDEFIKPGTTVDVLSKLRPAFRKGGSVTAGNASGINDGACAMLVASEDAIKKYNLTPKARIVSSGVVGVEPRIMGIGPVGASNLALKRAGLSMKDMDIIELNEAFAAQALACIREWGLKDNDSRINPNGGGIAIGHPLGMTGARLLQTAMIELQNQNKKYALCTMCIGVGQGYATIIEKL